MACRGGLGCIIHGSNKCGRLVRPVSWQLTGHATCILCRQLRVIGLVSSKLVIPLGLSPQTLVFRIPAFVNIFRYDKRLILPAQLLAGQSNFIIAQRCAMATMRTRLVRRAITNGCFAANNAGFVGNRFGLDNCLVKRSGIMAVDTGNNVPAIGLKTFRCVVGKPAFDMTINGNSIVVPESNELAESKRAGK